MVRSAVEARRNRARGKKNLTGSTPMIRFALIICAICSQTVFASPAKPKIVKFPSGALTLRGELFMPTGQGPFPAILYNHGSAPKMLNSQASAAIGPMFTKRGWVFFMPYRRGQGLSEDQGPYIMDEINSAKWKFRSASRTMVKLLKTDHLNDQLAALNWLKKQNFIRKRRIAVMGNSFGGIESVLGMANADYCAGVDAAGGSRSWDHSTELQSLLKHAVKSIQRPIFFFQAANDYNISPSNVLSAAMQKSGKTALVKIYPNFGTTAKMGHSFPYRGISIWFEDVFLFISKHCRDIRLPPGVTKTPAKAAM